MRPLLFLAVLAPFAGCVTFGAGPDHAADGVADSGEDAYRYTAYDSTGRAVVTGTLYVTYVAGEAADQPDLLRGRWVLDADGEGLGPQDGEGTLEGTAADDGAFSINLNPGMADNNVYLSGQFEAERARMVGEWSYSTFRGPTAGGRFEAAQ